jgi:hypothetical protein
MTSEVTELIKELRAGTMTLDEVAERFRERKWPRRQRPAPTSYLEMAARTMEDPEPYVPGSFDDVSAAFHRGDLSPEEYRVLSDAVAEAKREEDRRLAEGDDRGKPTD